MKQRHRNLRTNVILESVPTVLVIHLPL